MQYSHYQAASGRALSSCMCVGGRIFRHMWRLLLIPLSPLRFVVVVAAMAKRLANDMHNNSRARRHSIEDGPFKPTPKRLPDKLKKTTRWHNDPKTCSKVAKASPVPPQADSK